MNLLDALEEKQDEFNSFCGDFFSSGQGLRIGESSVASKQVHYLSTTAPGRVAVFPTLDAGNTYLGLAPAQYVHIDVYHAPGMQITSAELFHRLRRALQKIAAETIDKVVVDTNINANHVHILAPLSAREYYLIPYIVAEVEEILDDEGSQIRKVEGLLHQEYQGPEVQSLSSFEDRFTMTLPGGRGIDGGTLSPLSGTNKLVHLSSALGSVENAMELLHTLDSSVLGISGISRISDKHAGLTHVLNQLVREDLVQRTLWGGFKLTEAGANLLAYAENHGQELEAEFRKLMRKVPLSTEKHQEITSQPEKRKKTRVSERGRVIPLEPNDWATNLAISETVVAGKKNAFLRGEKRAAITREDLHVHRKHQDSPIDILLLIDASTSMKGKRLRAAIQLAEHLVLTTKNRVGVVVFQDKAAAVASKFTRNYNLLRRGLRSVEAKGLTPLAHGIVESLRLIREARARNPLLIMITDGLPTVPLVGSDPLGDSLEVAELIPGVRGRFVVIGLKPDEGFLGDLAKRGEGSLYVVEDLDRDSLVSIARHEKSI